MPKIKGIITLVIKGMTISITNTYTKTKNKTKYSNNFFAIFMILIIAAL